MTEKKFSQLEGNKTYIFLKVKDRVIQKPNPKGKDDQEKRHGYLKCTCNWILVADDEPLNIKTVQIIFGSSYRYKIANDGQEALDVIKNEYRELRCADPSCQPIKLIMMDFNMPVMNGDISYSKIKEFLQENGYPRIPCITMTAYVEPEYRERME